ncbi:MAG: hypothetical protein ABFD50_04850 [Smithella sp.]
MLIKTAKTDDYIILPNPDHPISDFRQNNKGDINITGNTNHGAGVKARRGLIRGSGKAEDIDYLFDNSKFTEETAREWLDNYKEKSIMKNALLNKGFEFTMPLIKGYEGGDGFYHIQFGLSTTEEDLQGDEMTDKALDGMVDELKKVKIAINDGHNHRVKDLIGPTTDAWREGTDMIVDLRVRKKWEEEIKDLIDSETPLGGSIEGKATETVVAKRKGLNKELIDGVKLRGGALTDIPAAWNLRGSAKKSKKCIGSMCSQIMKSLEKDNLEVNNVKKSVINVEEAYESVRSDINEALDKKYGETMEGGWIKRECYLKYTMPESVIITTYSQDLYQIPYTRNAETNEIELSDPIPATNQIVTKMIEDALWMIKSEKPKNGGGNLTKIDETIPEGMDEKFVDKIKTLGDDGKKFLKSLLGVEETTVDPIGESGDPGGNPNPSTGGAQVNKTMMSKDDVQKMLDAQKEEIQKDFKAELEKKDEKIESLEKGLGNIEKTTKDSTHKALVSKALELHKELNPTPEGKTDITEEEFIKSLELAEGEEDLTKFNKDELEKDPDGCIKTAIKGMAIALKKTVNGDYPLISDQAIQEQANKYAEQAKEVRKSLDEQGR